MARYEVTIEGPDGQYAVEIEAPENASQADIEARAQAYVNRTVGAPTQATHGLPAPPELVGQSPMGARLPLQEVPPIPEVISPQVRETPAARTPLEAAATGTTTELQRLLLGAKMAGQYATGQWPESRMTKERLNQIAAEQAERVNQFPAAAMAGQVAPYMLLPGASVATLPRSLVTGGTLGALASGGEPVQSALGAAGGALGYAAGRALGGPINQLNPGQQQAIRTGERIGFRASPASRTGSPGLMRAEAAMESSPIMQGTLARTGEANQGTLNRIAAESIGEATDYVDNTVLGLAHDRIQGTFRDVAKRTTATVDEEFLDALDAIERPLARAITKSDETDQVSRAIDRILERVEDGRIAGRDLADMSSELRTQAYNLFRSQTGDRRLAQAYGDMSSAVDDLMQRYAPGDAMDQLMEARRQWSNLRVLESPGAVSSSGDVSGRSLRNILQRKRPSFRYGREAGEIETPTQRLHAAARFSTATPRPFGSSGTAERMAPAQLGAAWYGGTQMTGEPVSGALAGLGIPSLASRLYGRYPFATGIGGPLISPQLAPMRGAAAGIPLGQNLR